MQRWGSADRAQSRDLLSASDDSRAVCDSVRAYGSCRRADQTTEARAQRRRAARPAAEPPADPLDPNVIGARVKALREAADLSLRDLAARSGVSAPMLSQVERGETSPTLTVAARIAAGLELRLSQLLRLDEGSSVTVVRTSQRQRGGNARRGHRFEVLTALPARPARRALAPHARARRRDRRARRSADARAGQPRDRTGRARRRRARLRRAALRARRRRLRHLRRRPAAPLREPDGAVEAAFLAVVSAGLRRS